MKTLKLLVATAIIAIGFTACEKEECKPVRPIERPVIKIDPAEIQAGCSETNFKSINQA